MSAHCDHHPAPTAPLDPAEAARVRRTLWIALLANAAMFLIEVVAGLRAGSVALLADAIDFGGDAANYAVSIAVLGAAARWRARAAQLKAASMIAFGLWVLGDAAWSSWTGRVPDAATMGVVGTLALATNVGVALLLYRLRGGDANLRSAWLCSRNDAIGNLAVMLAAVGVFGTGTGWPDVGVAVLMAGLALHSGWVVLRQARGELDDGHGHGHGHAH